MLKYLLGNKNLMDEKTIAINIKRIRKNKEMTLKTLAEKSGLTKGYISKIENFQKVPSYPTLLKIAQALETEITSLIDTDSEEGKDLKYYISKRNNRKLSDSPHPFLESPYESLTEKKPGKNMKPFILYPDEKIKKMVSHIGEKLIYVIEGSIEFFYGEERLLLEQGDHIYLDAEIPHGSKRVGDVDAKIMMVLYFYKRQ
jgi:transcriptional regulator with XRE-family HTH domain